MGIDVNKAEGQASRLRSAADEVRQAKSRLEIYRADLLKNWQGTEVGYIRQSLEQAIGEADQLIRELEALGTDVSSVTKTIRAEEEEAARKAAAEAAAREKAAAEKKAAEKRAREQAAKAKRVSEAEKLVTEAEESYKKLCSETEVLRAKAKRAGVLQKIPLLAAISEKKKELELAEAELLKLRDELRKVKNS